MADEAWTKYIDVLTKTLNQQKERDIASMDSKLAARGIAKGGAYGAGINDISGRYADTLAQTLAQIELEKAKVDQAQNFELQKQQNLFKEDERKAFGYLDSPYKDMKKKLVGGGRGYFPIANSYSSAI